MIKLFFFGLFLSLAVAFSPGAVEPYTEPGVADFDSFLQILEPHGNWEKDKNEGWIYFPTLGRDKAWHPYQAGRWRYSDWGWLWEGKEAIANVCYYYGWWKRVNEKWGWIPDVKWDASRVEWRVSDKCYGWNSNFRTEKEVSAGEQNKEWFFIPKEKLTNLLKAEDFLGFEQTEDVLLKTEVSQHILTIPHYRDFVRAGPSPKEVTALTGEKIVRHTIMCLSQWDEARPERYDAHYFFIYRPKIAQDKDGIQRRIDFWVKKRGFKRDLDEISHTIIEESVRQTVDEVKKKNR